LNKSNLALQKDKSVILIVQVTGTDEKVDVTWTSSDSTKVTVTVDASDSKKATVK
jgi:hypothetical protein